MVKDIDEYMGLGGYDASVCKKKKLIMSRKKKKKKIESKKRYVAKNSKIDHEIHTYKNDFIQCATRKTLSK